MTLRLLRRPGVQCGFLGQSYRRRQGLGLYERRRLGTVVEPMPMARQPQFGSLNLTGGPEGTSIDASVVEAMYDTAKNYLATLEGEMTTKLEQVRAKQLQPDLSPKERQELLHLERRLARDILLELRPTTSHAYSVLKEDLHIPRFHELSNDAWIEARGPQLTRQLAKAFRLMEDAIVPRDLEVCLNMTVTYEPDRFMPASRSCQPDGLGLEPVRVGRGNLVSPHLTARPPIVACSLAHHGLTVGPHGDPVARVLPPFVSLLLLDVDFPEVQRGVLGQCLLWAVTDLPNHETRLNLPVRQRPVDVLLLDGRSPARLPYLPPHPHKGSGFHRHLFVLLGHSQPLQLDADGPSVPSTPAGPEGTSMAKHSPLSLYHGRLMSLQHILASNVDCHILGLNWFLSSWTKSVSYVCKDVLGIPELAFGQPVDGLS